MLKISSWKITVKRKGVTKSVAIWFLAFTFIFTKILNNIADKELTKLLNTNNQTIYTYNYSVGPSGLLLAIPAALFSMLITIGLLKLRDRFFPSLTTLKVIVFLLKLIKLLGKGVLKLLVDVGYSVFVIPSIFSDSGSRSSSKGGGSPYRGDVSGGGSSNSNNERELKNNAQWQARQKQKEADYAWKHAGKQAQHNVNTHHFNNRVNRANLKQHEANEAAKRARNL
ncbi:hypothetical protein ACFFGV_08610 [Pontibacillus salicampi]|uniref:Uncharacterized protein n=1 Tax=Pontibacillus salicampi TaxID=1449801 RepID=A0ABV6LMK5_9BACI